MYMVFYVHVLLNTTVTYKHIRKINVHIFKSVTPPPPYTAKNKIEFNKINTKQTQKGETKTHKVLPLSSVIIPVFYELVA